MLNSVDVYSALIGAALLLCFQIFIGYFLWLYVMTKEAAARDLRESRQKAIAKYNRAWAKRDWRF